MPAERPYTYAVPDGMAVAPGSIVRVPLGPRQVAGIVWDSDGRRRSIRRSCGRSSRSSIARRSTSDMRRFVDWVATYTLSPPGLVARMLLRAPDAFDPEPWIEGLQRTEHEPDRMTRRATRVLELADDGFAWTRSGLAHAAGVSSTVIDGLRAQGVFETVDDPAAAGRRRARPGLCRAGA